jgi:hypothetical protein
MAEKRGMTEKANQRKLEVVASGVVVDQRE